MAKKKVIQAIETKFKVREYSRCKRCGDHTCFKKYGVCRICFRELAYKDRYRRKNRW